MHVFTEIVRELLGQVSRLRHSQPRHFVAISAACFCVCCLIGWGVIGAALRTARWLSLPSANALSDAAISASGAEAAKAAQDLERMSLEGTVDLARIRRLAEKANDPSVKAIAFSRIASLWDYESMPLLLSALKSDVPAVRRSSAKAIAKLLGRDHRFPVDGTDKDREKILKEIEQDWNAYRDSPLFKGNRERLRAGIK